MNRADIIGQIDRELLALFGFERLEQLEHVNRKTLHRMRSERLAQRLPAVPDKMTELQMKASERGARVLNTLRYAGVQTEDDIRRIGIDGFCRMPNCGRKTLRRIGELIGETWGPSARVAA